MAQTLADALKTGFRVFHQTIADFSGSWMQLTDPIREDNPTYVESVVHGITTYSAQVASPTPIELGANKSTTSVAAFEEVAVVSLKEARDIPGLVTNAFLELGRAGGLTLSRAFWNALAAADTTTHPLNGTTELTAQGGGTVYLADAFTVTPKNASPFNQQNLYTDALSASALDAALAARWEYRDLSGNETEFGDREEDKPFLIVPAALTGTALNLVGRPGEVYDGSGLQKGGFRDRIRGVVTIPGNAADDNDWFLWWRKPKVDENGQVHMRGPIVPWLRVAPRVRVTEAEGSNHIKIVAYMEYALHYDPTADQLFQMHKVA